MKTLFVLILVGLIIGCSSESPRSESQDEGNEPEPASSLKAPVIPGIAAVDVYGNMENAGLQCTGPRGTQTMEWTCKESTSDHEYTVEVIGSFPTSIEVVKATSLNYGRRDTDAVARDFLGYVASLPYDGSSPAAAQAWVQQNVGTTDAEKVFGSVRIQLFGNAKTRMLRMVPVKTGDGD